MGQAEVRFLLPAPELRPYVTAYYTLQLRVADGVAVEDRLHPEWGNLRFALSGRWQVARLEGGFEAPPQAALFGPTSRSLRIRGEGPGVVQGVGLTGLGWSHLIGTPAHLLADQWTDVSHALGDGAASLLGALRSAPGDQARAALLDAALLERHRRAPAAPVATATVQALLLQPDIETVEQVAQALGLSARQVERLCREHFGFPPKRLLNRARFMRTLASVRAHPGQPWRELIDIAYCDHSHFVRDFRRFMGAAATSYFAGKREILAPAADAREAALGEAYQALHPAVEPAAD